MAEWITGGEPELDVQSYRASRFSRHYGDPGVSAAEWRARRTGTTTCFGIRSTRTSGAGRGGSARCTRGCRTGCVFGVKNAWERADWFEPGKPWRRAGPDQRAFGWTKPPWFPRLAEEHAAFREAVGIIDMTSFGKIEVSGPGALGLLRRVAAGDVDRPVGSVVYTQWLDARGGIVADVTVTRLGEDRFRVVTGAGTVASDLEWLRAHARPTTGTSASAKRPTSWAVIGLWGPRGARRVVAAVTADDVSNDVAVPAGRVDGSGGRRCSPRGSRTWASWGGSCTWSRDGRCRCGTADGRGRRCRHQPAGYRALDSLRLEKGYRYFGTDLTPDENPFRPGWGSASRSAKGRTSSAARPRRSARVRRGSAAPPHVAGRRRGVRDDLRRRGRRAGRGRQPAPERRLRLHRRAEIGYVYLPAPTLEGGDEEIDVFDRRVGAVVGPDVTVDPAGDCMRGT